VNPYARLGERSRLRRAGGPWLGSRPTVPWPLLVALGAAVFMVGLVATWSLLGPARYETVPKPRPAATEQTVFVPIAECDRFGCVPVVNLVTPAPGER